MSLPFAVRCPVLTPTRVLPFAGATSGTETANKGYLSTRECAMSGAELACAAISQLPHRPDPRLESTARAQPGA
eukprot:1509274-Rhodomonas_salina.2